MIINYSCYVGVLLLPIHRKHFLRTTYYSIFNYVKSKLDEGDFHTALTYFQKALQIRIQKGNEALIHSTKLCIAYCMSRR
ncbi:hypothetical protein EXW56_23170 [Bacillus mycoides]|nr:hypothetical protein EXW56_23170 [Bacillus mycoides]